MIFINIVTLFSLGYSVYNCDGARILLVTVPIKSHMLDFAQLGGALVKKGHDVYSVVGASTTFMNVFEKQNIRTLKYGLQNDVDSEFDMDTMIGKNIHDFLLCEGCQEQPIASGKMISKNILEACKSMFSDKDFLYKVSSIHFDLAIVDGLPISLFSYILPYKLDIPYISYTTVTSASLTGIPAFSSFSPQILQSSTEQMSFKERLSNFIYDLAFPFILEYMDGSNSRLSLKYAPEKPSVSLIHLARKSIIWLINTDYILDYPRVSLPHIVGTGGMTTQPSRPLNKEFKNLMKKAVNGVLLVSFGSIAKDIPLGIIERLISVFSRLNETIIWRYDGAELENIPSNIHIHKWIPQNDLLGHPKVKAFMTHCGNNGQFEALYHGMPMIGFPLFADQPYNAARMEYHKYGLKVNPLDFTENELFVKINEVMEHSSFRENIKKASKMFKSRPQSPKEKAVYWVEHVIEFGADHLLSYGLQMPWYQYWMVDVIGFLLVLTAVFLFALLKLLKLSLNALRECIDRKKVKDD